MQKHSQNKLKLLHLIVGLSYGGAEKVVFDLVKNGDKSNIEYFVFSISDVTPRKKDFESIGYSPYIAGLKTTNFSGLLKAYKILIEFIKANNIELIHAHMFHAALLASMVKIQMPKIKVISTSHNVTLGSKWRDRFYKLTKSLRNADIIFSSLMKRDIYCKNLHIIPNGIEIVPIKQQTKNNKFTYISIAGLRTVKNHIHLVDCAQFMLEQGISDFEIWLVGKGKTEQMLKKAIVDKKLDKHIILKGFQKNVLEFATLAHCFVMPSHWEGFPISILEAGLAKLPVLATPVGSVPDMLNNNCGYLANLDEFAKKMIWIKENHTEATLSGENLYKKVHNQFNIKHIVKQHEELYFKNWQAQINS